MAESAEVVLVSPLLRAASEDDGVDAEFGEDGVDSGADGSAEPLLVGGCWLSLELGVTACGDRGAALLGVAASDVAGLGLLGLGLLGLGLLWLWLGLLWLGLGELAVVGLLVTDVTGGGVLAVVGGASLVTGAGESWVGATGAADRVGGGATALGWAADGAGADAGSLGSALGTETGAGATVGTSAAVGASRVAAGASRGAAGSGTTVVDGADGSSPGLANAGATPPVSAVNETTIPDASTAHAVRRRHTFNDAPTVQRLLSECPPTLATGQLHLGHRLEARFVTGFPQAGAPAGSPPAGSGCSRRGVRRTSRRPGDTPPRGPRAAPARRG